MSNWTMLYCPSAAAQSTPSLESTWSDRRTVPRRVSVLGSTPKARGSAALALQHPIRRIVRTSWSTSAPINGDTHTFRNPADASIDKRINGPAGAMNPKGPRIIGHPTSSNVRATAALIIAIDASSIRRLWISGRRRQARPPAANMPNRMGLLAFELAIKEKVATVSGGIAMPGDAPVSQPWEWPLRSRRQQRPARSRSVQASRQRLRAFSC